ncbi:MAG: tRNA guanosine(34) transglycosylase Tgt [Deltaproteobacteria bacterium]
MPCSWSRVIEFETQGGLQGRGRLGCLQTPHGTVATPAFMPVGTRATVRGLTPGQLVEVGVEILLSNTYHLVLRPGVETIARLGGLHRFMGWDFPILTDSGGYQLFSLAPSVSISEEGAVFRSIIDGARVAMSPESVVGSQQQLGVDIAMAFDVLTGQASDRDQAASASDRTLRWARRTIEASAGGQTAFFGIMQGGIFEDLRRVNAGTLVEMPFAGYAVGGLSVGEATEDTMRTAEFSASLLPVDKPRYMMGMGTPPDLVRLAGWGYDLFDCVVPTRNGRNGTLYTRSGIVAIRNARHADSPAALEEGCDCYCCKNFSRAYLHHLSKRKEMLAATLGSLHNLRFYQRLMSDIRVALGEGRYEQFSRDFLALYERRDS